MLTYMVLLLNRNPGHRMNQSTNSSALESWLRVERSILAAVLSVEMVLGIVGNGLILTAKAKGRHQFKCQCLFPLVSLSLSDFGSSLFIISGSLLAVLNGGQRSPWCEVVSLLKFAFITSSLGSLAVMCLQRTMGWPSMGTRLSVVMAAACLSSWLTGVVFGSVPLVYDWVRYDPAEMLCVVVWETSYTDMMVYIVCAFAICIFPPFLLILVCSLMTSAGWWRNCNRDPEDLSSVTPLLVGTYLLCYTPFTLSELILLGRLDLSPAPEWLRTLSSVMAYLNCGLNPLIYCTNRDFRMVVLSLLWSNHKMPSEPVLIGLTKLDV